MTLALEAAEVVKPISHYDNKAKLIAQIAVLQAKCGDFATAGATFLKAVKLLDSAPADKYLASDWFNLSASAIRALGTECAKDIIAAYQRFLDKARPDDPNFDRLSYVLALRVEMRDFDAVSKLLRERAILKNGNIDRYAARVASDLGDLIMRADSYLGPIPPPRKPTREEEQAIARLLEEIDALLIKPNFRLSRPDNLASLGTAWAKLGRMDRAEHALDAWHGYAPRPKDEVPILVEISAARLALGDPVGARLRDSGAQDRPIDRRSVGADVPFERCPPLRGAREGL